MFRSKFMVCLLAPMLVAAAILSTGCGASHPEQQQLQQFFRASGLRDDQTLANFAKAAGLIRKAIWPRSDSRPSWPAA